MTEQDENTLNRLLDMVQDLDNSAASDGANNCHPSVKTETLYEKFAIALRHAITDRAQRQAGQEPTEEMIQAGCLSQQATPEYDNYDDWCSSHSSGIIERIRNHLRKDFCAMLAAAPQPAREPLTEKQIRAIDTGEFWDDHTTVDFARAIEQAHGIGIAQAVQPIKGTNE